MATVNRFPLLATLLLMIWPVSLQAQEAHPVDSRIEPDPTRPETLIEDDHGFLQSLVVDYEIGPLYILQNDGQYGEEGTLFTAADVGQQDNLVVGQRTSVEFPLVDRHTLIFLYAPLDVTTRVTLDRDLRFRTVDFAEGTVVDFRYLFDGTRVSYLWGLLRSAFGFDLDLGASVQIRNANVAFTEVGGTQHAAESDIGIVFALKTRLRWDSPWGPYAVVDFDGLSTFGLAGNTTGGIYDTALTLGLPVLDGLDLIFRARGIGGGADVPDRDLYNWAHFLAFTSGVRIDLPAFF